MTSSWKRRGSSIFVLAALTATAFFYIHPTAAAVTPVASEALLGGKHWRFDTTTNGPVHVWTPPSYDASTAITVIHVHGDAESYVGSYTPGKYSDAAWVKMRLPEQFNASGLNALFIFPDGPVNKIERDAGTRVWKSLDGLLASVKMNIGQPIPEKIVVSGHSGAYKTMQSWTGNAKIVAFVLLDSIFDSASTYSNWFNGGPSRRLAVVHTGELGVSPTGIQSKKIAGTTSAKILDQIPNSASDLSSQTEGKRAVVMKSQFTHSVIISSGQVMPVLLPWAAQAAVAVASGAVAPAATGAPTSTSGAAAPTSQPAVNYRVPTLEIPIPNVEFTDIVRANGQVTVPWLAQYIGGVYTFLLSIAGLLAAVMMVVGGFQYVTSAGDQGKIGAGKKRIVNALTGLLLALGSFTILYSINPSLTKFEGLQLHNVNTRIFKADNLNATNENGLNSVTNATQPATPQVAPQAAQPAAQPAISNPPSKLLTGAPKRLCTGKAGCKSYCEHCAPIGDNRKCDDTVPKATQGMATLNDIEPIPADIPGVTPYNWKTSPRTIELLRIVGPRFFARGFKLAITSAYRPLEDQLRLACNSWDANDGKAEKGYIAQPGGSFHGIGFAIDVQLWKDGKKVTISGDSAGQQKEDPAEVKYLTETMLGAGFRRLNNEIWHFEPANAPDAACRCDKIEDCSLPPHVKCL